MVCPAHNINIIFIVTDRKNVHFCKFFLIPTTYFIDNFFNCINFICRCSKKLNSLIRCAADMGDF